MDNRPEGVASNNIHYDQAGFRNGKGLNLSSERSHFESRPKRYLQASHGFPQTLQANDGKVLRLDYYRFLPNPFQLIQQSPYHRRCILRNTDQQSIVHKLMCNRESWPKKSYNSGLLTKSLSQQAVPEHKSRTVGLDKADSQLYSPPKRQKDTYVTRFKVSVYDAVRNCVSGNPIWKDMR